MTIAENKYGLLGFPLAHSLSPRMHNAALDYFDLSGQYFLFEKKGQDLEGFLKNLNQKNITGINVTIPYKEKVLNYLDWISEDADSIKAVNTIVNRSGRLEGFNTDWQGFLKQVRGVIGLEGAKVALLGAGGAAKAVAYALIKNKIDTLSVFDIDLDKTNQLLRKAEVWASDFGFKVNFERAKDISSLEISGKNLLINATPVGLKSSDPLLVAKDKLHRDLVVCDLIYNPAQTKLLTAAKELGLKFVNGMDMLVYQGAQSFLYFTGADLKLEEVAAVMKKTLEEK